MKKSQIQLGESTAVVIVIMIMIIIGIVVYYQFWQAGRADIIEEEREIAAIELATKTNYMPELHCTFQGRVSSNCYDWYKLAYMSLNKDKALWQNYYFDYFGFASIEMFIVYPEPEKFVLYNNTKSDTQSEQPVFIPSKIYEPILDTYSFGYMKVTKYT